MNVLITPYMAVMAMQPAQTMMDRIPVHVMMVTLEMVSIVQVGF